MTQTHQIKKAINGEQLSIKELAKKTGILFELSGKRFYNEIIS